MGFFSIGFLQDLQLICFLVLTSFVLCVCTWGGVCLFVLVIGSSVPRNTFQSKNSEGSQASEE